MNKRKILYLESGLLISSNSFCPLYVHGCEKSEFSGFGWRFFSHGHMEARDWLLRWAVRCGRCPLILAVGS